MVRSTNNLRNENEKWLFICCGKRTEIDYVKQVLFPLTSKNIITFITEYFDNNNKESFDKALLSFKRNATEKSNTFSKTITIMDLEGDPNAKRNVNQPFYEAYLYIKNEEFNKITSDNHVFYSLPSIEYWFLLHFEDYAEEITKIPSNSFKNAKKVIEKLQKYEIFSSYNAGSQGKSLTQDQISFLKKNYLIAISNLEKLNNFNQKDRIRYTYKDENYYNPSTSMGGLIELISPKST